MRKLTQLQGGCQRHKFQRICDPEIFEALHAAAQDENLR
jgi:hypothetical protein